MKHAAPEQICDAVELLYGGLSSRKVATSMASKGLHTSHVTIQNWGKAYAMLMEEYFDTKQPQVGEAWRTDEIHLKVKGRKRYLFAMLDGGTRYWIAKMIATHKGNDDVAPMFAKAEEVAGKVPTILISDGAYNFRHAWKKQYKAKNFLHKDTRHVNEVAFDGIHHNNKMESFNGNTIRHREKVTRGIKKEDSGVITGLRTYHNFVRPHLGLPENQTPAEAAGIHVQGTNKLKTIIQAATKERRV
jgi:transposase-like protein